MQGVSFFNASSKDVQGSPLSLSFNAGCRTVRHPVSPVPEYIKMPMPGAVLYRNKGVKSGTGMLRYRKS